MIIDSHCHSWAYWPYLPEPPYPESHGSVETLINRMDLSGVNKATIVCAQIFRNKENNDYVASAVKKYPDRLDQFADVDSFWSETYHTKGAAGRLESAINKWPMKAFTHYLAQADNGDWMNSQDGRDFFKLAEESKIIASVAMGPQHQNELRKVAERHPNLNILCHHMSGLKAHGKDANKNLQNVLESSKYPNIHLKLSGFHYVTDQKNDWNFPYRDTKYIYEECYQAFGTRMCWGSDFPVVRKSMTYRQSLEAFRTYCDFVTDNDKKDILGGTLGKILDLSRKVDK